jgi:DsbC/DsbD-like thiol-disulfide interchange protein
MFRAMKSAAILVAALTLPAISAHAAVGDWVKGQRAEVRLLASGIGADGKLAAGVEIALPDGWTTYWRNPGDAGIAPLVDFSASQNIGTTDVAFPVPTREDDGADTITNVYRGTVVFPVSIAVADPTKPVDLALNLHVGVCQEICVPEEVTANLIVPPADKDATADAELTAARALIPGAPKPGTFALDTVTRNGGTDGRPVFRITGIVPDAANAQVFVEGPADWAPYTPEFVAGGRPAWDIKFSRTGAKTPIAGAKFRLTIQSGSEAIDQTLTLN